LSFEIRRLLFFPQLANSLRKSSPDIEENTIDRIMKNVDLDSDGQISYKELCAAAVSRRLLSKEERMWRLFRTLDRNGDGRISAEEVRATLGHPDQRFLDPDDNKPFEQNEVESIQVAFSFSSFSMFFAFT
jgi:Ca2+-binding EF-hand superfamily protein